MRVAAETDMVAVVPSPTGEAGRAFDLVGFVARSQKSADEIIDRCRASLPSYMVPSRIHKIADWPLNTNGKTDYKLLTARLQMGDV